MDNRMINIFLVFLVCLAAVMSSRIYKSNDLTAEASGRHLARDLEAAASGHHGHGRVQIKVYRGPNEGGHDHFAPHGYWVKQPADDDRHH